MTWHTVKIIWLICLFIKNQFEKRKNKRQHSCNGKQYLRPPIMANGLNFNLVWCGDKNELLANVNESVSGHGSESVYALTTHDEGCLGTSFLFLPEHFLLTLQKLAVALHCGLDFLSRLVLYARRLRISTYSFPFFFFGK